MTALRRAGYPLALVAARLRRRGGRVALVGAGIAAGAAALALVSTGSMVIRDRSLGRAATELPAPQRAVQATWFGTLATGGYAFESMDAAVRPQLARATGVEPVAAMLYREASIGGRLVDLRAADHVGRWVHLLGGRLPRACTPARCEVLRLAGTGPLPSTPSLRLVQVGTATLRADAPFRDFVGRPPADTAVLAAAIAYHTPPPVPLVLAEGVDGLSRTPELSTMYRSYAWFAPLPADAVRPWSVDRFRAGIDRLRSTIGTGAVGADAFDVTAPDRPARGRGEPRGDRRTPAAPARRRDRRAPARVRAPRRLQPAPRRGGRAPAARLGRGAALAARARHRGGVRRGRRRRHARRLGRGDRARRDRRPDRGRTCGGDADALGRLGRRARARGGAGHGRGAAPRRRAAGSRRAGSAARA